MGIGKSPSKRRKMISYGNNDLEEEMTTMLTRWVNRKDFHNLNLFKR